MPVVVNNPQPVESSNNNWIGVLLILALVVLFVVFLLPRIGGLGYQSTQPQVNVPGNVNVHLNK